MRRLSFLTVSALFVAAAALPAQDTSEKPLFSFGAVADCQYCDVKGKRRRYRLSPGKLAECVEHFNRLDPEFVIHLGDFIDRDFKSFDVVGPIFNRLKARKYHVLGNHDFSVADELKGKVPAKLGLSARYYDFEVPGWRFVVLDGNDVSLYAHPRGSAKHREAEAYYRNLERKLPKYNGAVGAGQLSWLKGVLGKALEAKERVVLFAHHPVYPKNAHNLWNDDEIRSVIEASPAVAAYINGHNHAGHYGERKGVHYLTLKGMVDTEESAYALIRVYPDRLHVEGHGREKDRTLKLRAFPSD